ncbi:hypothetical protein J3E68DRAFT_395675 [Trichoderma sp. SZMC 28012]
MSGKSRLDKVYAQLMSDHPYGWGLYKKVTTPEIHPGSCGYFDSEGDWRSITDLSNPQDLNSQGWTIPDDIHDNKGPRSTTWGPKSSSSIQNYSLGGNSQAGGTAAALRTSMSMSYENTSDQGAILCTESPVTRHQIGDELSAVQWMAENTAEMMRRHKHIIKRHGVWIVTKTYSTRRCAITIMTSKSSTINISLDYANGLLTLTPHSTWTASSGNSCTELHEDDNGVVVFISGVYFYRKLFRSKLGHFRDQEEQKDKIFRGDNGGSDDESNELDVEYWPPYDEDDDDEDKEDEFSREE